VADVIGELAAKSGVSPDLAGKGLGAILLFLKGRLPAGVFAKLQAAVPDADGLMAGAQAAEDSSGGGLLGAATGALRQLSEGLGSGAGVASKLTQLGFSPEQLQKFLPNVMEFCKSKLPADVAAQVSAVAPGGG
jgi:hypothetical protein